MKKNVLIINSYWCICIIINLGSIVWFILGNTANFQRGIDLVSTITLMFYGIPSTILLVWSIIKLSRGGISSQYSTIGVALIIVLLISLSVPLYKSVNTNGWLTENIKTDSIQLTENNQYEYCIELVNTFQKNSLIRLYLKNTQSAEEKRITLDLPDVIGILWDTKENYFITLDPTDRNDIYILKTQKMSPFPEAEFEINVQDSKAIKVK